MTTERAIKNCLSKGLRKQVRLCQWTLEDSPTDGLSKGSLEKGTQVAQPIWSAFLSVAYQFWNSGVRVRTSTNHQEVWNMTSLHLIGEIKQNLCDVWTDMSISRHSYSLTEPIYLYGKRIQSNGNKSASACIKDTDAEPVSRKRSEPIPCV